MASKKINLLLYHDILDALENYWCQDLKRLIDGHSMTISFDGPLITLITASMSKDVVECEVEMIGTGVSQIYTLRLSQVIKEMKRFINEIFTLAIQKKLHKR